MRSRAVTSLIATKAHLWPTRFRHSTVPMHRAIFGLKQSRKMDAARHESGTHAWLVDHRYTHAHRHIGRTDCAREPDLWNYRVGRAHSVSGHILGCANKGTIRYGPLVLGTSDSSAETAKDSSGLPYPLNLACKYVGSG